MKPGTIAGGRSAWESIMSVAGMCVPRNTSTTVRKVSLMGMPA
jgi:hypothetical protein